MSPSGVVCDRPQFAITVGGTAIAGLRNFDGNPSENAETPVNLLKLARQPRDVNHLQAIVGADSTHNSMNVIFYGLLGEI